MSATCYSDEYDDVMISGKWFLVFHHCAGIAAPGAPANKANSLLIAYNPLQPVSKIISNFYHVLIEPGILSKAVTLAALPSRLQPPFPLRMPISPALRTSCPCPHEHSPMPCSSHFFQTCTQETVLFLKPFSCPLRLLFAKMCCSTIALKHYLPL